MNQERRNQNVRVQHDAHQALRALTLDATLCADITHRIVDEDFELVRIGAGITRLEVLNGAMKNMGADGLLDES
jgi:hypothetical protein